MQESSYLVGRDDLIDKLRRLPLLQSLDEVYLQEILKLSKLRKYAAGETITPEGVFDCWFYIVISGAVRIVKRGEEIARLDQVGDTFGEMTVIDGGARSASVEAVKETLCLAVDASFLDRADPADKHVFYSVIFRLFAELLANRLRSTSEELVRVKEELERCKQKRAE